MGAGLDVEMYVSSFGIYSFYWYQFSGNDGGQEEYVISVRGGQLKARDVVVFDTVGSVIIPFGWEPNTPDLPNPNDLKKPEHQPKSDSIPPVLDRAWTAIVEDKV